MRSFPYDINCDLGEEKNVEAEIMPLIQSANIACGAHAGNDALIEKCILLAMNHGVKIGIHPSYPDRINFGRVVIDISTQDLVKSLEAQIDNFITIAKKCNAEIYHLKFHGALYNQVAKDRQLAIAITTLLDKYPRTWKIFCPPNSIFESILRSNNRVVCLEAFLDRAYNSDGTLVSRNISGAILNSKEQVFNQFNSMIQKGAFSSIEGKTINMKADTYCIHGDHENSVEILKYIKDQFSNGKL